ncbi:MAG: hypothetical protein ACYCS8_04830 [Acidithiobacillus sp.]
MAARNPFPRLEQVPDRLPTILPIPAAAGRKLFDNGQLGPSAETLASTPRSRDYVMFPVSRIILPVILEDLEFLGLAEPDIRIIADWMPETDPPVQTGKLPPLVTQGRVCIAAFTTIFCLLCRATGASTTAHRRYKNAFVGERIHIVIDANRNAVRMHMSDDLRDALNDGFTCWARGR